MCYKSALQVFCHLPVILVSERRRWRLRSNSYAMAVAMPRFLLEKSYRVQCLDRCIRGLQNEFGASIICCVRVAAKIETELKRKGQSDRSQLFLPETFVQRKESGFTRIHVTHLFVEAFGCPGSEEESGREHLRHVNLSKSVWRSFRPIGVESILYVSNYR